VDDRATRAVSVCCCRFSTDTLLANTPPAEKSLAEASLPFLILFYVRGSVFCTGLLPAGNCCTDACERADPLCAETNGPDRHLDRI